MILAALMLGQATALLAQERERIAGADTLIELESEFKVVLSDAVRIKSNPRIETPEVRVPELTYSLSFNPLSISPSIAVPSALKMDPPKPKDLQHNLVRIGYGNYNTPLFDAYFNMPGKKGHLGIYFNHLSSRGPRFARFDHNRGGIEGKKFYKKVSLDGSFLYNRHGLNYFGFDPERFVPQVKDSLAQAYTLLGGKAGIESMSQGKRKNAFRLETGFFNYSDKNKQTENEFLIKGYYRMPVKEDMLHIHADYSFLDFKGVDTSVQRHFINLKPYYAIDKKKWNLQVGFNMNLVLNDSQPQFYFFPKVVGEYKIDEQGLTLFGGFHGDLIPNTYRRFTTINPFVGLNPDLTNTSNRFEFNAGLKGKLSGNTGFVARLVYNRFQDFAIFIQDSSIYRRFKVVHDDVKLIRFNIELSHQYSEKFRMALIFNYNNYTGENTDTVWQVPNMDIKLNSTYNIGDKILLSADVFFVGKRYGYVEFSPSAVEMKPFLDASLGIDYRWKKQISAFVRLNNLAGRRFQYYMYYPQLGFNAMAGLSIGF